MAFVDESKQSLQGVPGDPLSVPYPRYGDFSPNSVQTNRFYISTQYGGFNDFLVVSGYGNRNGSTLPNCTAYAAGRYSEISGFWNFPTRTEMSEITGKDGRNATSWWKYFSSTSASKRGWKVGSEPAPGAILCFNGHVEVVEKIIDKDTILTTGSGSGFSPGGSGGQSFVNVWLMRRRRQDNWVADQRIRPDGSIIWNYTYKGMGAHDFQGFVYNNSVSYIVATTPGGPVSESSAEGIINPSLSSGNSIAVDYKEVTAEVTRDTLRTADYSGQLNTHTTGLLTIPTYVEAPYISVRFGDYVLGTYTRNIKTNSDRVFEEVEYPNYINSLQVKKINGSVNQYTIGLVYVIQPGQDPNFIDKVLSSVQYGSIYISYGDCNAPNFYYKEEEALIINVQTSVDFSASRINYTISATSSSFQLYGGNNYFPPRQNTKPSDVIFEIFQNENYGIKQIFRGMTEDNFNLFVARNDKQVNIEEKRNSDPLSYINYLVTCMVDEKDTSIEDPLKSSNYYMTIEDDQLNEYGGSYFTVQEVFSSTKTLYSHDTYEVDIGFPTPTMVENFSVNDNNSWALLYRYSDRISPINYTYSIDNQGNIRTEYSPSIMTSGLKNKVTPTQKTWWTQMTQFPISATLTIKGLVRPAMLMTYIRVNAYFYGQRHIASGLYVITGQTDTVDGRGYRTTLSLQRIGSDEDYIIRKTETITTQIPVAKPLKNNGRTNKTTGPVYDDATQYWRDASSRLKQVADSKKRAEELQDIYNTIDNDPNLTTLEKAKLRDRFTQEYGAATVGGMENDLDDVYGNADVTTVKNRYEQSHQADLGPGNN